MDLNLGFALSSDCPLCQPHVLTKQSKVHQFEPWSSILELLYVTPTERNGQDLARGADARCVRAD